MLHDVLEHTFRDKTILMAESGIEKVTETNDVLLTSFLAAKQYNGTIN